MYSFLLRKALPFTLTFIFGAALSGLPGLLGSSDKKAESVFGTRTYEFGSRCRTRRHRLVAESKPLAILFKPDAWLPASAVSGSEGRREALVRVTFGADGKIQDVKPLTSSLDGRDESLVEVKEAWDAVERAARNIRFTPETVNSVPVSVTRDVEIRLTTY